jgi:hypothetical protein
MAYGTKTANIMDVPLSISSVFAPYVGDNGYKWEGMNSVRVLSVANGTLSNYNEADASTPFGAPVLVVPLEQTLALAYNKSMLLRIQQTQIQDIPLGQFAKTVALQQADQVFVPAHDAYSLAKVFAARPSANAISQTANSARHDQGLLLMVNAARKNGAAMSSLVLWISYTLSAVVQDAINYTGADPGYINGKSSGYLGKIAGVNAVEVPDSYFFAGVSAMVADKRSIINVTPKMDPKAGGMKVLTDIPGFSGVEIQLRDRSDTFVLNKKVNTVATLETPASTTTTATTVSTASS